ncbi:MAG: glycosyltransferase family 1 protein [Nitrospirae bacterium]|nr:glycosyltransferase family 1 protein [Nitrospirota bacterium]
MQDLIAQKYAVLSTKADDFLNDLGKGYIREFVKRGAVFIDYEKLYLGFGKRKSEQFIRDSISRNGIEVLLYQSAPYDFHYSVEFFHRLREKVFTVMMLGDTEHYFDARDIYYAQCMDLIVVYDCLSRYRFRQYGLDAISFYSSFDKNRYFKLDIEKDIDVSFVGDISNKVARKTYIDYIAQNAIPVEVFGNGSKNGQVSMEEMTKIFNRTRINLNFTRISLKNALRKEPNINLRLRQIKGRAAEVALCGGFVLSEYASGIEEVFEIDKEVVVFHSNEDMLDKIKYYLEHEDERNEIAENSYKRALRDYELSTAIPKLISRIEDIRRNKAKGQSELYVDNHFLRHYTTFRVAMAVKFLRLRKWSLLFQEAYIIFRNRRLNIKKALGIFLFDFFPPLKKLYHSLRFFQRGE